MSIEFYDNNAEMYINDTMNVDMRKLYNVFEQYLNQGDTVLDIGGGSGWYQENPGDRFLDTVLRKLKPLSFLSLEVFSLREKLHALLVENFLIKDPVPLCIVVEHKKGMRNPYEGLG